MEYFVVGSFTLLEGVSGVFAINLLILNYGRFWRRVSYVGGLEYDSEF